MLFYSFFFIFFLPFLKSVCLGFDSINDECIECAYNEYMTLGLLNKKKLGSSFDCHPKPSEKVLYSKNFYIRELPCSNSTTPSLCDGSRQHPFDNFIKAIVKIHNDDLAGQYMEQKINIYFIGKTHYIRNDDLIYPEMRIFRQLNASILIRPWFCEDEIYPDCIHQLLGDLIDLIIKTDKFQFEIYRNLKLMNIRMIGNDIILKTSNTNECYFKQTICCETQNPFLIPDCKISEKVLYLSEISSMGKFNGLFMLRNFLDDEIYFAEKPILNLENIEFLNFHSFQAENNWLSLIVINDLNYNISLKNSKFVNNTFPFGYIYQIQLIDDPYYNFLSDKQIKNHISKSFLQINEIYFDQVILEMFNTISLRIFYGNFDTLLSIFNFINEKNSKTNFKIKNIKIISLSSANSLMKNTVFNIIYNINLASNLIYISFDNISFLENINFGFINSKNIIIEVKNFDFSRISNINVPTFNFLSSWVKFNGGNFMDNNVSQTTFFLTSVVSYLIFNQTNFINLKETFSFIEQSSMIIDNCFLFQFMVEENNNFMYFFESNFSSLNTKLLDSYSAQWSGAIFGFYSVQKFISLYVFHSSFDNVIAYRIYQFESYTKNVNIEIHDADFAQMQGVWNGRYFYYFLVEADVGSMKNVILVNISVRDSKILQLIQIGTAASKILINNATLSNIKLVCFYIITISNWYLNDYPNSSIEINQLTLKDLHYGRAISCFWFDSFEKIAINNLSMINISCPLSIILEKTSVNFLEIYSHQLINLNHIYLFHNSLSSAFYAIYIFNVALFYLNNSQFFSNVPDGMRRFQVLGISSFQNVFFTNNTINGMSSIESPIYINDETGVASFTGSGSYELNENYPCDVVFASNIYFQLFYFFKLDNKIINSFGVKFGVIGIIGVANAWVSNNTFIGNLGRFGGGFCFYFVNYSLMENTFVHSSRAYQGVFFFLTKIIDVIKIYNTTLKNVSASSDGGSMFLKECNHIYFESLRIELNSARNKGGNCVIYQVLQAEFTKTKMSDSSSAMGGMFYIEDSRTILKDCIFKRGFAEISGGFGYLLGKTSLLMENNDISSFSTNGDGAIISSGNIDNFTCANSSFKDSKVFGSGNGIFNFEGYTLFEFNATVKTGVFSFDKIIIVNNTALFGSNIYFSSNNLLIVKNLISENNTGSLFSVDSDQLQFFYFEKCIIRFNNFYIDFNQVPFSYIQNPLLYFFKTLISFQEILIEKNIGQTLLFKIVNTKFMMINCNFYDFFEYRTSSDTLIRFFYVVDSFINSENNTFTYMFNLSKNVMLMEIKASPFFSYKDKFTNTYTEISSVLYYEDCKIILREAIFSNLYGYQSSLIISASDLFIDKSFFINNGNSNLENSKNDEQISDIFYDSSKNLLSSFIIENTEFYTFAANTMYIYQTLNFTVKNCIFYSKIQNNQIFNRALFLIDLNYTNLINTTFSNYFSIQGSVITAIKKKNISPPMALNIIGCNFFNNTAFSAGVFYVLGAIQLKVNSSTFKYNRAMITKEASERLSPEESGKAGVILIDCEYFTFCTASFIYSVFENNFAEAIGPTVLSKTSTGIALSSNIFVNNSDLLNYTEFVSSTPIKTYLLSKDYEPIATSNNSHSNKQKTVLSIENYIISNLTIASGQEFDFSILLVDNYEQLLIKESKTSAELFCDYEFPTKVNTTKNIFIDKGSAKSEDGSILFRNVKIVAIPNNNLSCQIELTYQDSLIFKSNIKYSTKLKRSLSFQFSMFVRKCIIGEIYLDDDTCFECHMGTYSIADPMKRSEAKSCLNCPDNSFCKGGKHISPLKDYWRNSINSTLILKCLTPYSCLGIGNDIYEILQKNFSQFNETEIIQGKCAENYEGNFCFRCKKGLARFKANAECQECQSLYIVYIKMVLSSIFMVLYISFQAKVFSKIEHKDPHLAVLTKLLLNHFQTVSMINLIDLGWTVEFNFYFSFQDYLSFLSQDFFVIDCMIQNIGEDLLVQKIIFTTLLPVILSLVMLIIWSSVFLYLFFSKKSETSTKIYRFMIDKMRITLLILIFILYPEILRKSFSLLNCMLIDNYSNLTVLSLSPNVQCWSSQHSYWVKTASVPGLVAWGIVAPVAIMLILRKHQNKIMSFIQETQTQSIRELVTISKKEIDGYKMYRKKIFISMEEALAKKLFNGPVPPKSELRYSIKKTNVQQIVQVEVKTRDEIMEDYENTVKRESILLDPFVNENSRDPLFENKGSFLVVEPSSLYRYLEAEWKINEITQEDLKTYAVHIKEELKNVAEDLIVKKSISGKIGGLSKSQTINLKNIPIKTLLIITNLGFIYRGYRKEYYYWEIMMFSRKFILIFIGVFTEFFPKQTKPTMLLIILISYIFLQITNMPYQFTYLNHLEIISLITSFLTALIGVILFSEKMQKYSILFLCIVFFVNVYFLIHWAKYLIKYGKIKEKIQDLKGELRKYQLILVSFLCCKKVEKTKTMVLNPISIKIN